MTAPTPAPTPAPVSSPFRVFARVVAAGEFPAIVDKAIADGLARARDLNLIPIAVQISGGTRAFMDAVADTVGNLTDKHESVMLLPDKAISQFKNHADVFIGGEAIVVLIHSCDTASIAEVCLEDIANGAVPVRMGAWMRTFNVRFDSGDGNTVVHKTRMVVVPEMRGVH